MFIRHVKDVLIESFRNYLHLISIYANFLDTCNKGVPSDTLDLIEEVGGKVRVVIAKFV